MNVLGICAGRHNGNTEIMMKEAFMAIEAKCGATCKLLRVQDVSLHTCTGCEACMMAHLHGDNDFRCVHNNGTDHFYFIEQLMREADAIIVSSPAYNLLPTGQLVKLLNKMHASGDYREVVHRENKIAAAFTLGGTDWTNFALPVCRMIAMELAGSYEAVVDSVHFDFVPGKAAVLLEDDIMARMAKLGENVADALLTKEQGNAIAYRGAPGICPDCHGTLLEVREDGVYCPQCLTRAEVSVEDGKLAVRFTPEEMARNRWSPWGQELHDNNIRKGHGKAAQGRDVIQERLKKYVAYERAVELPPLVAE